MTSIDELIAKSKAAEAATASVEVLVGGELVTLKFTELPGKQWAEITIRNPAREDVPVDIIKGYNVHAVTQLGAVKSGVLVGDDAEQELSEDQWRGIFDALSGADFQTVIDTVWSLNEWAPTERVENAKKALRATASSGKK